MDRYIRDLQRSIEKAQEEIDELEKIKDKSRIHTKRIRVDRIEKYIKKCTLKVDGFDDSEYINELKKIKNRKKELDTAIQQAQDIVGEKEPTSKKTSTDRYIRKLHQRFEKAERELQKLETLDNLYNKKTSAIKIEKIRESMQDCVTKSEEYNKSEAEKSLQEICQRLKKIEDRIKKDNLQYEENKTKERTAEEERKQKEKKEKKINNYINMIENETDDLNEEIKKLEEIIARDLQKHMIEKVSFNRVEEYIEDFQKDIVDYDLSTYRSNIDDLKHRKKEIEKKYTDHTTKQAYIESMSEKLVRAIELMSSDDNCQTYYTLTNKDKNDVPIEKLYDPGGEYTYENTQEILAFYKENNTSGLVLDRYKNLLQELEDSNYIKHFYEKLQYLKQDKDLPSLQSIYFRLKTVQTVLLPTHSLVDELLTVSKDNINTIEKERSKRVAEIAVSQFHKDNINKLFFTKNLQLDPTTANKEDFDNNFDVNDSIMGVAYFDDSYNNKMHNDSPEIRITTNQTRLGSIYNFKFTTEEKRLPYMTFVISSSIKDYNQEESQFQWTRESMMALSKAVNNDIYIHIGVIARSSHNNIYGSFEYNCKHKNYSEILNKKVKDIDELTTKSLELVNPGNLHTEENITNITEAINKRIKNEQCKKVIITSDDWSSSRNKLGVELGRTLIAYSYSLTEEGTCLQRKYGIIQEKVGNDYTKFLVDIIYDTIEFPKEKI